MPDLREFHLVSSVLPNTRIYINVNLITAVMPRGDGTCIVLICEGDDAVYNVIEPIDEVIEKIMMGNV